MEQVYGIYVLTSRQNKIYTFRNYVLLFENSLINKCYYGTLERITKTSYKYNNFTKKNNIYDRYYLQLENVLLSRI